MTAGRRRTVRAAAAALLGACLLAVAPGTPLAQDTRTDTSCFPVARHLGPGLPRIVPVKWAAPPGAPAAVVPAQASTLPALPEGTVQLTYLGHSSFLIRTPANVSAITDYNGYNRAEFPPTIVTMNRAHSSHYTDFVEPGVQHILRGWATPPEGYPRHNLKVGDLRVRNVVTNIRDGFGGTDFAGNSIFIFETQGFCIAHFGHLHHRLDPDRLGRMGQIDVAMVPVDGSMTLPHDEMAAAVAALNPRWVVPMHVFGVRSLDYFVSLLEQKGWKPRRAGGPDAIITRSELRTRTTLVFPEELF